MGKNLVASLAALLLAGCASAKSASRAELIEEHLRSARSDQKKGDCEAAISHFEDALSLDGSCLAAVRGVVSEAASCGRLDDAMEDYKARVEKNPEDHVALYALGLGCASKGGQGLTKATEHLKRAAGFSPATADYHFRLGLLYLEDEEFEKAKGELTLAVQADGGRADYYPPLALSLGRLGEKKAAMDTLAGMLALSPGRKQMSKARKVQELLLDPFARVPAWLADDLRTAIELLDKEEFPEQALKLIEELSAKKPDVPFLHTLMGLACQKMGRDEEALIHYKEAVKRDPLSPGNYDHLADMFLDRGRIDRAEEFLKLAIETNPLNTSAYRKLGDIRFESAQFKEAIAFYEKAAVTDRDNLDIRHQIGMCHYRLGNLGAAEKAFKHISKRDGNDASSLIQLGIINADRSFKTQNEDEKEMYTEKAHEYLEKAIEVEPTNTSAAELLRSLERK